MTFQRIEDRYYDNLIGWWDLQETSGATAAEVRAVLGGVLTLTAGDLANGTLAEGPPNGEYTKSFQPSAQKAADTGLLEAAGPITSGAVNALTVAAWCQPGAAGAMAICAEWLSAGNLLSWWVGHSGDYPVINISNAGTATDVVYTADDKLLDNTWYRELFTFDAITNNIHIYVNGAEVPGAYTTGSAVLPAFDTSENFTLHHNSGVEWNSSYCALRVWQRYFTAEDAAYDYQAEGGA